MPPVEIRSSTTRNDPPAGAPLYIWREFQAEQREHNQPAPVFGHDGYVWSLAEATFENWQSEFLQLFTMLALTSLLIFKGSPESRDSDDEMRETLSRLERQLDEAFWGTSERSDGEPTVSPARQGAAQPGDKRIRQSLP